MSEPRSVEQIVLDLQKRNRALSEAERTAAAARLPRRAIGWLPFALVPMTLGLWLWSIQGVDLRNMNDLGLVSVLGPAFPVALVLLAASMAVALVRAPPNPRELLVHVLVLVVILYGTVPMLVSVPQGASVYRYLGVANYITRHGPAAHVTRPGFFAMTSALTSAVGSDSAIAVARWGPLLFNLLFLVPVLLFFRSICRGVGYTWLCVWLFFCCNWVGQDYFSPQAYGYLGYLAILAVVVALFRTRRAGGTETATGATRAALLVLIVLAFLAVAITHPVAPYALAVALGAFAVARGTRLWWLPVLMAVVSISVSAFAAAPVFTHFLRREGRSIQSVSHDVSAGIGARLGSPEHVFVVDARVALTVALLGLAVLGIVARRRMGLPSAPFVAMAVSTVALVAFRTYGGEVFARTYLFSLPPLVLLGGAAVGLPWFRPRFRGAAIGALSVALLMLFVFARYGDARLDYFSPQEVHAITGLYRTASPGSLLMAGSGNLPWRLDAHNGYSYETVDHLTAWTRGTTSSTSVDRVAGQVVRTMASARGSAYLIFMRSMEPWEDFLDRGRAGELIRVERAALRLGAFRAVYRNRDASIYVLKRPIECTRTRRPGCAT